VVPCSQPHDNEVYYVFELSGSSSGLDDSSLLSQIDTLCQRQFTRYIGVNELQSAYGEMWLWPSTDTWAQGDREGACYAYANGSTQITGTVKGIKR